MEFGQLNIPKIENQQDFDWLMHPEEQYQNILQFPSSSLNTFKHSPAISSIEFDLLDFDAWLSSSENRHLPDFDLREFDGVGADSFPWDYSFPSSFQDNNLGVDANTAHNAMSDGFRRHFDNPRRGLSEQVPTVIHGEFLSSSDYNDDGKKPSARSKSATLGLDEIQKHFDVPITKAAREMNVGLTVLKKRCRELNITRWPHRKIKSLKSLIANVKEMGMTEEVQMLEEHKRMLEKLPEMELTERTKKLRQACFKANYKKRRSQAAFA